MVEKTILVG